ncbi:hypothetical protein M413DRAFT_334567 [Hebeloma cylindrosporum]|uniref:DUF6533 domain-containing protein n=1 Tax=Hebeloma cylindrosporum TaxID=76867 RepID=A0A0C2Y5V2_HEBCY|nr:hypothetical protein M413DRAFT_334567 [Hebeloma cylindrosporum h7]
MTTSLGNEVNGNRNAPLYFPFHSADGAAGAQAVNRSSVAALAFLVWDILITVDDEVNLIWPRAWNYTKYVYFLVRYLPMLVQVSILLIGSELTPHFHFTAHDCYIWQIYQGVAASSIVAMVDTVLILRIYALYHGPRHHVIRRIVIILFTLELLGLGVGLGLAIPGITYDDICLIISVPHSLIIFGGSSVVIFQFLLFGLTLYKFIQAVRSGWGDVPLIMLLMRDGTWAFFLLSFLYVGQIGLYAQPDSTFAGVLYCWLLSAFSFCGYRILLNLNRLAERTHGAHVSNTLRTGTNIQFTTQLFHSQQLPDTAEGSYELSAQLDTPPGGRTLESSKKTH